MPVGLLLHQVLCPIVEGLGHFAYSHIPEELVDVDWQTLGRPKESEKLFRFVV